MSDTTRMESEAGPRYGVTSSGQRGPRRGRPRFGRHRVSLRLVRHGRPSSATVVSCPADVAHLVGHLAQSDRERVVGIWLSTAGEVLGTEELAVGSLDAAIVHPRETFKCGLLLSAASLVLAHNHPSGNPEPSPQDRELTRRLVAAGELLGVPVLDHVVVGARGFVSFAERGWM